MDLNKDFLSIISTIIRKETRWLRHYLGEVVDNNDTIGKGRVKVTLPELGYDTASNGIWCFPRQADSLSVPVIGAWVEVYFLSGNSSNPVYLSYTGEITGNTPTQYDGKPTTRLLFESPETNDYIKYDDTTGTLTICMLNGQVQNIILQTGDASAWCPNILAACPFSGALHGGVGAGIVKLIGA